MAVRVIESLERMQIVILADSRNALRLLQNVRNNHPVCMEILHNISTLKNGFKDVKLFCPSHVGKQENEEADRLAVAAAMNIEEYYPCTTRIGIQRYDKQWGK